MSKYRESTIDTFHKSEILSESSEPGAVIADVARRHGIEPSVLYSWRSEARQSGAINHPADFVEVGVSDDVSSGDKADINRVSIDFSHCSLSVEGKISTDSLCGILKLLGE
jgi:transposase